MSPDPAPPAPPRRRADAQRIDRRLALIFVAPAIVLLLGVTIYPVVWVCWLSLQRRVPVLGIADWVGTANYRFLARDPAAWNAAAVTATFVVASVGLEVILGVAVALALRHQQRQRRLAIALLLVPWCLPGVVTARTFEWIYHPTAGLANGIVGLLGGGAINWLGDPAWALVSVIAADVWRTLPFVALLCYARLLGIPAEIYEAASIDGAGAATTFRAMTLPLLAPVLLVVTLLRTLDALRAFDLMFVLTGGGPAGTTETLTLYAYRNLFQTLQLGFGAAVSVVVFVLVALTALAYMASTERGNRPA